jgi:hypothetical protein
MSITDEHTLVLRRNTLLRQIAALAGWILAAAALVAFANDLVSFAQTGTYRAIPAGEVWFNGHVASLNGPRRSSKDFCIRYFGTRLSQPCCNGRRGRSSAPRLRFSLPSDRIGGHEPC